MPAAPPHVSANVATLVAHTRDLAGIDRERTRELDVRSAGVGLIANGLLATGVALGPRFGRFDGAPWVERGLPYAYAVALALLLLAAACAAFALRLHSRPVFGAAEVAGYKSPVLHETPPLEVELQLLARWTSVVARERETFDAKLAHLRRAYACLLAGIVTFGTATATLVGGGF